MSKFCRRTLTLVLMAALLLICAGAVLAAEPTASGSCGENLSWTLDGGTLTVTGSGEMTDWSQPYQAPWHAYRGQIQTVVLGEGVTTLGGYAFDSCTQLQSVTFPGGLAVIGQYAFNHCTALTGVTLPEGLYTIESNAFAFSGLRGIVIPDSVETVNGWAFYQCTALETAVLPEGLVYLEDWMFTGCTALRSVVIPDSVMYIDGDAFSGCVSLPQVRIPASICYVSSGAFADCTALKKVTFCGRPDKISDSAFAGVTAEVIYNLWDLWSAREMVDYGGCLTWVFAENSAPVLSGTCGEDVTWEMDGTGVLRISGKGPMVNYFRTQYYRIDAPWIEYRNAIRSVVVEEGVTSVGNYAFVDCDLVRRVTLPEGLTSIGMNAFYQCYRLLDMQIPNTVESIGSSAFGVCQSMETLTIPAALRTISAGAFADCWSLTSVEIPARVETIQRIAFGGCYNLEEITFLGRPQEIDEQAFLDVEATVYYDPADGWTGSDFQGYGGELRWVSQAPISNPFTDVKETDYYYDAVLWALSRDITAGTSANTFAPNMVCTRSQVVTFLWRAAGQPEPETTVNPFTDVKETDYFYKAVLWAVEKNITSGVGGGRFGALEPCTRSQVVTFLWRDAGQPWPESMSNPFSDVKESDYYYFAVLWAAEQGITAGNGSGFAPLAPCTRSQVVSFLYRAYA